MADQLLTLRPNTGTELEIDGVTYRLGLEPDWGEAGMSGELVTGPDIFGAVSGAKQFESRQRTITVQVRAETGEDYLAAATALASCISAIQRYGGTIVRQLVFTDGDASEALECEVLQASFTEAEDGWLEANRLHGEVTISLTTQPYWLAEWTEAATVAASTASLIECPVDALRGNLPGPGRIVLTDNASTARRFVELGGAFENYEMGMNVEFRAGASGGDFSLTGADGSAVTTSVTDRIGTHTIAVSPVFPEWTTVAFIEDQERHGTNVVRARSLCEDEDATVTLRALWRSGSGAWKEVGEAEVPSQGWWDLDLGTLSQYDEADTFDVRFDVRSTEFTTSTFRLNIATITPTDLYTVVRGETSAGITGGATGFDEMSSSATDMASRTSQLGGAWTAFGSNGHFTNHFDLWQQRTYEDAALTAGRGYILNGLSATTAQTVIVRCFARVEEKGSNSICGAIVRYADSSNWGLACLRHRRTSGGNYKRFLTLYKCIAGTLTNVKQREIGHGSSQATGAVEVSIDAAGAYEVAYDGDLLLKGTDSVFATSGTLDDGKMGFYGASTSNDNELGVFNFIGYAETSNVITTYAVRFEGTGELTYAQSFSADADGSDPRPVSSSEGRRIWLPPNLDGLITAKVRTSDSDAEVDTGHSNSTLLTVNHRPAFANLSDALGDPPPEDLVML